MVREIELSQGMVALVDDNDYEELAQHRWYAHREGRTYYARRHGPMAGGTWPTIRMHREIIDAPHGIQVDHINGDGLDNRRDNLRIATNLQNGANRTHKQRGRTSRFLGVDWYSRLGKWRARIMINYKDTHLGYFDREVDAALAYNEAALQLHGEYASLNDIDNPGVLINVTEDNHG